MFAWLSRHSFQITQKNSSFKENLDTRWTLSITIPTLNTCGKESFWKHCGIWSNLKFVRVVKILCCFSDGIFNGKKWKHYRKRRKCCFLLFSPVVVMWVFLISQECSLGDPFQKMLQNFDLSINMALVNGGFLHYRDMKKFLKKSSFSKLLVRCWNNFTGIFLEWPFSKIVLKKLFLQKPLVRFWNNFTGMFLGWPFSKIGSKILIRL